MTVSYINLMQAEDKRPTDEVASRHKKVLEQFREGYSLEEIAAETELTLDHVRVIMINHGESVPTTIVGGVSSIWDLDEDARRIAFARLAQRGARKALGIRGRPAASKQTHPIAPPQPVPLDITIHPSMSGQIIAEVARKHGLGVKDLTGPHRASNVVLARNEAVWRMRTETKLSFPQIGLKFGRDHTTMLHSYRQHAKLLAKQGSAPA